MPEEFRYEAALGAVYRVLELILAPGQAVTPQQLSGCVYAVLDHIYACERREDGPRPILCTGCFALADGRLHAADTSCPNCGRAMTRPAAAGHN
jgi:predicted RNA-binding Zn-ribbon protein involved in translation (DUF1610 family)